INTPDGFIGVVAVIYIQHCNEGKEQEEGKVPDDPVIVKPPFPVGPAFFYGHFLVHAIFSAILIFAVRERGFDLISPADGVTGFLVITRSRDGRVFLPYTSYSGSP